MKQSPAKKPVKAGDVIQTGVGREEVIRRIRARVNALVRIHGESTIESALAVHEDDVWEFLEWFSGLERRAAAESADPGARVGMHDGSDGAGVPMGPAARHVFEITAFLNQLRDNPEKVLRDLDRGRGIW